LESQNDDQSFLKHILSLFRRKKDKQKNSKQEIEKILDDVEERGIIEEDQGDMIHNIIELKDTAVREIMVPKGDMVALERRVSLGELIETIKEHGCSRIPIYENSMDNIIGVVYAKDVLNYWNSKAEDVDITQMMHPPYFVPEGKKLIDLLNEFRQKQSKIAIIIDEYGNVDGLLTMGDLIEEIVGDMQDEDEQEQEQTIINKGDGVFQVDPKIPVDEFSDAFGMDIPDGNYDTIAGFITSKLERIPKTGETLEHNGVLFEIASADKKRISRLVVHAAPGQES